MTKPSTQLIAWLRTILEQKNMNSAGLAAKLNLPRARVRKVLAGREPMTVDELMQISSVLELNPADFVGAEQFVESLENAEGLADAESAPTDVDVPVPAPMVDPWGNHPEQFFRVGFTMGVDFFFTVDTAQIEDSGVPKTIIRQYEGRELPIKLDAMYHAYNEPRYHEQGITLTLSFDALYDCTFPWSAIKQFIFFPVSPDAQQPKPDSDEDKSPSGPHLRLVT